MLHFLEKKHVYFAAYKPHCSAHSTQKNPAALIKLSLKLKMVVALSAWKKNLHLGTSDLLCKSNNRYEMKHWAEMGEIV